MGIGKRIQPYDVSESTDVTKTESLKPKIEFELQKPKYNFDDLVLHSSTKEQIERAIAFKKHSDLVFNQWGLGKTHKHSNRVCLNFYGVPGTGKTMAAHAVADYLEKQLLIINYAEIESKYVGETPKNLVAAFKSAQESDSIIFFDEADALLSRRVTNMSNSTDTSVNQTRSVLLNILNDYEKTVLFATNFIENFDPAFMRRILAHVHFQLPEQDGRLKLFKMYIPEKMPHGLNVEELSQQYENLSGSDIANAVLSAALSAANRQHDKVEMNDMHNALKSIIESKKANSSNAQNVHIETREVTKAHVEKSLGRKL